MKTMLKFFFRILLVATSMLAAQMAAAATCTSLSSGTWSSSARWSCGYIPLSTDDVVIATGHNVTTPGSGTSTDSVTVNAGAILTDGGGNFTVNNSFTLNGAWAGSGFGRLQMNGGSGTNTIYGTGTISNETLRFSGGANFFAAGANITFTGATQIIDIRSSTTVTNNGTVTVGRMTGQSNSTSIWVNAANSTLNIAQDLLTTGFITASASGNTVNFNGAAQTVETPSGSTYYNLSLGGSGTKTMPGVALTVSGNFTMSGTAVTSTLSQVLMVNGDFTLNSGTTFNAGTPTHIVKGNFTNNGTFNSSTGEIVLSGGAAQTLIGATTFYDLTINNASGVTLNNNVTVSDLLTLTDGIVTTGTNSLVSTRSCTLGVSRTNGWIAGTLQKVVPTGAPTCVFEIGDGTSYLPVTLAFTSVTASGNASAWLVQTVGDHPNTTNTTSGIDATASVNRYWTLASTGLVFTTITATFKYLASDLDTSSTAASFIVARGTGCSSAGATRTCTTWVSSTPGTAPTTTQTSLAGLAAFGDFVIGSAANGNFAREPELIHSREVY